MLSKQILYRTIRSIHEVVQSGCSVWNTQGDLLVSEGNHCEIKRQDVTDFLKSDASKTKEFYEIKDEYSMFAVCDEGEPDYVFVLEQGGNEAIVSGKLCVIQLEGLINMNKEKMDRNRFIQNLILDNLLVVDIYNQAKKLSIQNEQKRVVILIEPKDPRDLIVQDTVRGLYTAGTGDYVTAVDEGHVILVKALQETDDYKEILQLVEMLVDIINTEAMVNVRVAFGTIVKELKDVPQSYKEALMALNVGRIFYEEKNILAYKELGIGRLIHQLPSSLCKMFLDEIFAGKGLEQFDDETLSTVDKFFENNLNISETARQLYVHRNTLVYRLEKIQKQTGLDVRKFEDAMTFKIALMVSDHMKFVKE